MAKQSKSKKTEMVKISSETMALLRLKKSEKWEQGITTTYDNLINEALRK